MLIFFYKMCHAEGLSKRSTGTISRYVLDFQNFLNHSETVNWNKISFKNPLLISYVWENVRRYHFPHLSFSVLIGLTGICMYFSLFCLIKRVFFFLQLRSIKLAETFCMVCWEKVKCSECLICCPLKINSFSAGYWNCKESAPTLLKRIILTKPVQMSWSDIRQLSCSISSWPGLSY